MQHQTKFHPPIEITVLLYDRFSNLCLANCLEPLRAANGFAGKTVYHWRFATPDGTPVASSSGMQVAPDIALGDARPADYLFVLSSYDHLAHDTPSNRRALQKAAAIARMTVGFDTGAWLMAAAGLLRHRQATVHWDVLEAFAETFLDTDVAQARWLTDGPVATCAGAMAAFDMVRTMVREHAGAAVALDVDGLFLADRGDAAPAPQPAGLRGDPVVRRAIALMRANIETPLAQSDIAGTLRITPRTLARRFETSLGQSPGATYRHIRLSAAHQMVTGGTMGIAEIALRCGYESPAALTRAFQRRFGSSPQAIRRDIAKTWL